MRIATNAATRAPDDGRADRGRSSGSATTANLSARLASHRAAGPALACWIMRVTVVVPTYNEADNIETLIRAVRQVSPEVNVLVIDDGSPDGTADRADELARTIGNVQVVRRDRKDGLGAAYRAGLRLAIEQGADICVQMDADLSHDPASLPALVAVVQHGADVAIGSRYVPGGITLNWPRRRRWVSRWGNRYAAGILGLAINDVTAGYRAYSAQALERMTFDSITAEGYGFQIEMTYRIVRLGGKVVEFPITFRDRMEGESKFTGSIMREALGLVVRLWIADFGGRRRRRAQGG